MSTKYNVGWLRDEKNQIFIPFTYTKSVKLDDNGTTLDSTVGTVGEHTNQLKNQNERITALENGTTPAGTASKTVGKLTVGNSSFNGSEDITVTAKDLGITGALVYRGISTEPITNGGNELPKINNEYVALSDLNAGNIVLYKTDGGEIYQEFVWTGDSWELLGDEGSYALKSIEIVAGDGLVQTGTTLRDNIEIRVNPDGITITTLNDQIALKIINPEVTSEDIAIETNGVKTFTLPSVTVDKYGRVTAITNKTIKLNDVTDKINTLISDVSDLESSLSTVIKDIAGDGTQIDNIVPRINTLETRTKYVYAADDKDTVFAIVGGDGNVAMQVDANGITSFDFKIDDGDNPDISVKESLSNLKTTTLPGIEDALKAINDTKIVAGAGLAQTGETISDRTITLTAQTDRGLDTSTGKIGHTNSVTAGTAKGTDTGTLGFGGQISIPSITYDAQGHIKSTTTTTVTLPSDNDLQNSIKTINDTKIISGAGLTGSDQTIGGTDKITLAVGKGTGIVVNDDNIALEAISPALTTGTTYGSNATNLGASTENFNIPQLKVDTYGRVTSIANKTINITEVNNNIKANTDAIKTKAAQTDLNAAVNRISANEAAIATKAAQTDLNNAVSRISANETAISTLQNNDNEQNAALGTLDTKIEVVKNNIAGLEPEKENNVENPDYYNWNILPRISETEERVQYINELDDTNFAIVGKDGNVAFQVNADGTTKSFDFTTATGNTVNTNTANIAENASGIAANASVISSHTSTLSSHTALLSSHSATLSSHAGTLSSHATILSNHGTSIAANLSKINANTSKINENATVITTKADKTITIKGDEATTTGGGDLSSNRIISLKSIVTASNYGPTSNITPSFGTSFTVPQFSVDKYGRVIQAFNRAITIPSVGDLQNAIATNANAISSHAVTLSNHTSLLSSHSVTLSSHTASIAANLSSINNHATILSSHASSLATHTSSINTNANGIATNANSITTINSNITSIKSSITTINSNITLIKSSIAANTSAINTKVASSIYTAKIGELENSIKANTDQLAINATRFDSNDNELITIRTNDNLQNEAINRMLERIGDTEMRTQYIHPYPSPDDCNAFAVADNNGGVVLEVQTDGTTKGINFITANGNSIDENESRIETLENNTKRLQSKVTISTTEPNANGTQYISAVEQDENGVIDATINTIPVFGANSNIDVYGLVPPPTSANTDTFLCSTGEWRTVSTADEKVQQDANATSTSNHPILATVSASPTSGADAKTIYNTGISITPKTSAVNANVFNGGLNTSGKDIKLSSNVNYGSSITSSEEGILVFEEVSGSLLPSGGTHGQVLTNVEGTASWADNIAKGVQINPIETDRIYVTGTFDAQYLYYNNSVYIENDVLMGAAWNDYAEYRICKDNYKPGQVVCENGDDTLSISTERLQPGAEIISDTFGFAIGQTVEATCPIAVSGRVLAYTYEPREEFKAGDPVCAGPNGTVSKMTREEVCEYPDRMIGTVSAIPFYKKWNDKVIVDNRIWIKIK